MTSIKSGMWDSIYDTFQAISQDELTNKLPDKHSEYESIDVEPSENDTVAITDCILEHRHSEYSLVCKSGFTEFYNLCSLSQNIRLYHHSASYAIITSRKGLRIDKVGKLNCNCGEDKKFGLI